MKKSLLAALAVLLLLGLMSCKKTIEQAKENALVDYMVANKWAVQLYTEGSNDVTTEFNNYEFQFERNNTVTGTNGTITQNGTWSTNLDAVTITAQFSNGTAPVTRLNGTWGVASYDATATVFSQTINGTVMKLILRKK